MLTVGVLIACSATLVAGPTPTPAGPMRLAPLSPAWTAASLGRPHQGTVPPGFGAGGLSVRRTADRAGLACLRELRRLGLPFKVAKPTRGVATPVVVTGPIRGLKLTPMWGKRPALMDCRFALTLYRIAPTVLRSGFNEWRYSSVYSYRYVANSGWLSRHAHGLAIDVYELRGPGGVSANVKRDWIKVVGRPSQCVGQVATRKARLMRRLVCNLERLNKTHLILTPDSDYAHRDHFHISGHKEGERSRPRNRYAGRIKGRTWIPRRATRKPRRRRRRARARARRSRKRVHRRRPRSRHRR